MKLIKELNQILAEREERPQFVTSFSNRGIVVVDREKGRGTKYRFGDPKFEKLVAKYPPYVHQEIKTIRAKYKDSAWYKEEMLTSTLYPKKEDLVH